MYACTRQRESSLMAPSAYVPSPIRRHRRTRAEMDVIRQALIDLLAEDHPATVRQMFYRLVARGIIAKTEAEYKGTICRLLVELRESGEVRFDWVSDNTRWMRKSPS